MEIIAEVGNRLRTFNDQVDGTPLNADTIRQLNNDILEINQDLEQVNALVQQLLSGNYGGPPDEGASNNTGVIVQGIPGEFASPNIPQVNRNGNTFGPPPGFTSRPLPRSTRGQGSENIGGPFVPRSTRGPPTRGPQNRGGFLGGMRKTK